MLSQNKTLFATTIFAVSIVGCIDPAKSFRDFDNRVIDAGKVDIGACGGELPDVSGEFFLQLSPSISTEALLQFIVTSSLDKTVDPAVLSLTMQPLCVQSEQCTVGQPIGASFDVQPVEVSEACTFEARLDGVPIDGGANALTGNAIIGNLDMIGSIRDPDLFCGIINGQAVVSGAPIPIDGSTFGAARIIPGTLGDDLPSDSAFKCPEEVPDIDAGVPDAGLPDAGLPDAT